MVCGHGSGNSMAGAGSRRGEEGKAKGFFVRRAGEGFAKVCAGSVGTGRRPKELFVEPGRMPLCPAPGSVGKAGGTPSGRAGGATRSGFSGRFTQNPLGLPGARLLAPGAPGSPTGGTPLLPAPGEPSCPQAVHKESFIIHSALLSRVVKSPLLRLGKFVKNLLFDSAFPRRIPSQTYRTTKQLPKGPRRRARIDSPPLKDSSNKIARQVKFLLSSAGTIPKSPIRSFETYPRSAKRGDPKPNPDSAPQHADRDI